METKYPKIDLYRTGQSIKRIMKLRGLTVRELQEYLNLSTTQSIYHWFDGRNMPNIDNLYALSELFHVPVDVMVCGNRKAVFYFCEHPCQKRLLAYYEKSLDLVAG